MKKSPKMLKLSRETLANLDEKKALAVAGGSNTWGCTCGCTQDTTGSNPTYNQGTTCGWGGTNDYICSIASVCIDQQH